MYRYTFSLPLRYLEVSGQLHAPVALPLEKSPSTHWIGGRMDLRAVLDNMEKWQYFTLPGLELRLLGLPTRTQSYTDCTTVSLPVYRLHWSKILSFRMWSWVDHPTYRRKKSPPSSGLRNESGSKERSWCFLLIGLFLDPEDWNDMFLRNVS
jgi:hypothetical protein